MSVVGAESDDQNSFAGLLSLLPGQHDAFYFVDTNMVLAYVDDGIPGWRAYVDALSSKGRRFFVSKRIREELRSETELPAPFHEVHDDDADCRVERACAELMRRLEGAFRQHEAAARWLLEAGFYLASVPDVPPEACYTVGMTLAVTANTEAVAELLKDERKGAILERVADTRGLEHIATVRHVKDGRFWDVVTLPPLVTRVSEDGPCCEAAGPRIAADCGALPRGR